MKARRDAVGKVNLGPGKYPGRMAPGPDRALRGTMKLCIFVGMSVGSWAGWALGESGGVMTAFLVGGVGSLVGVYLGWRAARALLE